MLRRDERIALTHDYLDQYGGAERTVLAMCESLTTAPLYTSVYDRGIMRGLGFAEPAQRIVVSFMQHLPLRRRVPRYYLTWLYPLAFRSFDLDAYDVVVSSATFAAKALRLRDDAVHVCYCYTPPRFLWGFDSDTATRAMPPHERPLAAAARVTLRQVDYRAAQRVNLFLASSDAVAQRIRAVYGRDARVVYPPVDTARFGSRRTADERFLLIVSRLNAYKHIDPVIDACNRTGQRLLIVGTGPWAERLRARAGPTVRLTGALPDAEVDRLVACCTAVVVPGEEDFGITAVEAMAAGKPVLALGRGGVVETVIDGVTGVLYGEPTADAFLDALARLSANRFDPDASRARARLFDRARFVERLDEAITLAIGRGPKAFN
jgi:glycosyltransferase involved in cell wall biosynthesis